MSNSLLHIYLFIVCLFVTLQPYLINIFFQAINILFLKQEKIPYSGLVICFIIKKAINGLLCGLLSLILAILISYLMIRFTNKIKNIFLVMLGILYSIPEPAYLYISQHCILITSAQLFFNNNVENFIVQAVLLSMCTMYFIYDIQDLLTKYKNHINFFYLQGKKLTDIFIMIIFDNKKYFLCKVCANCMYFIDEIAITSFSEKNSTINIFNNPSNILSTCIIIQVITYILTVLITLIFKKDEHVLRV